MKDILGKILSIIIAGLTIYYIICLVTQKQDNTMQTYVNDTVYEFINKSRATGYISASNYMELLDRLNLTGLLYNIEITHESAKVSPEYDDHGTFTGKYNTYYEYYTHDEVLDTLFNEDVLMSESNNQYKMKNGDYLTIHVTNKTPSLFNRFLSFITLRQRTDTIKIVYGGYVGSNPQLLWHLYRKKSL